MYVRNLSDDHRLENLITKLENIKWDIVGLSRVHRKEEKLIPTSSLLPLQSKQKYNFISVGLLIS